MRGIKVLALLVIVAIIFVVMAMPAITSAATEAEKQAAIDMGLLWLANQQNPVTGEIGNYGVASTAASVLSFAEEGNTIYGGTYQSNVQKAMSYIFNNAIATPISPQPAGNPDTNANNIGVKWNVWDWEDLYVTGLAVPAIVKAGTPGTVVTDGSQVGRTYADVVRDAVDLFAYAQNDPATGTSRGGWRYTENYGDSDNSVSQWPIIGMLYANQWGISPPDFVKTELDYWVNYIQDPGTGGSGYTAPWDWINPAKTGGLLLEQMFLGYPLNDPRVQAAIQYINGMWNTYGTEGNFGDAYAMWGVYKGLEITIGLNDMTAINPRPQGAAQIDNPDHGWNWFEDYSEYLVSTQDLAGWWGNTGSWVDFTLATPWYINILAATEIPPPPVPEPSTFLLFGAGLAGVGLLRRFRK